VIVELSEDLEREGGFVTFLGGIWWGEAHEKRPDDQDKEGTNVEGVN
jgi:hypothetical protein